MQLIWRKCENLAGTYYKMKRFVQLCSAKDKLLKYQYEFIFLPWVRLNTKVKNLQYDDLYKNNTICKGMQSWVNNHFLSFYKFFYKLDITSKIVLSLDKNSLPIKQGLLQWCTISVLFLLAERIKTLPLLS